MSDRKTLLPELLPDPRPHGGQAPRERVAARARQMLDRLSDLKTVAGAAVLAAHCGYGVVDPVPPPPPQCTAIADPFATLTVMGGFTEVADGGAVHAEFSIQSYRALGFTISAVRVTAGGTLVGVETRYPDSQTWFEITIAPDGSGGPILFEADLGCGAAAATKHVRATPAGNAYTVVSLD